MKKPPRQGKDSTGDDYLWDEYAKTVKPLRSTIKRRITQEVADPVKKPRERMRAPEFGFTSSVRFTPAKEVRVGDTHRMDARNAQKLKQGKKTVEARIDLHGMTQMQAALALEQFILHHAEMGKRNLLVITGHGMRSEGRKGVIREQFPKWLEMPHLRALILAVTQAQPKDGGAGAFYVMLKRKR